LAVPHKIGIAKSHLLSAAFECSCGSAAAQRAGSSPCRLAAPRPSAARAGSSPAGGRSEPRRRPVLRLDRCTAETDTVRSPTASERWTTADRNTSTFAGPDPPTIR